MPFSYYFFISFEGPLLRYYFSFFRRLPSRLIRGGRRREFTIGKWMSNLFIILFLSNIYENI